jgi:D-alanyl-D-alanine carboxypeptidase/D-alanyl-D-alanine-endopeptidase (penicillin-binding protein 4)
VAQCELYAAVVMSDLLREAGVRVDGPPRVGIAPGDAVELARYESPPVGYLLQRLLKRSDNLYAELFLRELGRVAFGDGTVDGGGQAVLEFLDTYGINTRGLRIADGSGLSRSNRVTVRATAGVLRAMAFHAYRDAFWSALPIAGVDGTLAHRMNGSAAEGNVRAKTGYISGCTSLSGYVTTQSGDLLVVSTIFNHHGSASAARSLHDQLFARLAESGR